MCTVCLYIFVLSSAVKLQCQEKHRKSCLYVDMLDHVHNHCTPQECTAEAQGFDDYQWVVPLWHLDDADGALAEHANHVSFMGCGRSHQPGVS